MSIIKSTITDLTQSEVGLLNYVTNDIYSSVGFKINPNGEYNGLVTDSISLYSDSSCNGWAFDVYENGIVRASYIIPTSSEISGTKYDLTLKNSINPIYEISLGFSQSVSLNADVSIRITMNYIKAGEPPQQPLFYGAPYGGGGGSFTTNPGNFDTEVIIGNPKMLAATLFGSPPPCITDDSTVLTPKGYVNVTELKKGDKVITDDNREVKITKIYNSVFPNRYMTNPYIIPKNSLALNYPPNDCRLSRSHLIKYNDIWIHPKMSGLFKQDKSMESINYYHVQLESYSTDNLVINGGLIVESLGRDTTEDKKTWKDRVDSCKNLLK